MGTRRARLSLFALGAGWLVVLAWGLLAGMKVAGTTPEHLAALLVVGYLAAWGPFFLVSRLGPAGRAARFVVCSAAIATVMAAFEVPAMLGLVDYRAIFSTPVPPWRRPGNRPDPDLIYVREGPRRVHMRFVGADLHHLSGVRTAPVHECDLQLDRNGFRNPTDLTRADVVILGDSFIEGLQVAAPDLITARLSDRTGATVANLGRTGYGPQQERHVLERYALALHPRVCVWAFYEGNDLQDVAAYDAERRRAARARPEPPARAGYARSLTRNALAWLLREWLHPDPTRPAAMQTGRLVVGPGQGAEIAFSCGVHEGEALPEGRARSRELEQTRHILAEAHAACRAAGVDLVIAFVPAKFRVYRDLCSFPAGSPCSTWGVDELPDALRGAVGSISSEIGYLDLTPTFRARAAAGSLPYLADDTHWSPQGHDTAARALAEFLDRRAAIRSACPPVALVDGMPVVRCSHPGGQSDVAARLPHRRGSWTLLLRPKLSPVPRWDDRSRDGVAGRKKPGALRGIGAVPRPLLCPVTRL